MSNYYTVTEYSKIVGKDPGNIRRMLINGLLTGEKIGKQWVIAKDEVYPKDRRINSGKYQNWRIRKDINQSYPKLLNSLTKMSYKISEIYGEKIDSIVLYGSYARNEATDESDVDIAVVLYDEKDDEAHDKMTDIVVDYELDMGVTLSVVPINYHHYKEWKSTMPFYKNVDKEGIVLWKTK